MLLPVCQWVICSIKSLNYSEFIGRKKIEDSAAKDGITSGKIDTITTRRININSELANGVDLSANYTYDHYAYGTFGVSFRASYLNKLEKDSQFEGVYEKAGDFRYPRWKARLGLNWVWQLDHDITLYTNYRHNYTDTKTNVARNSANGKPLRVNSRTTFDLSYQYRGFKDVTLRVGAVNLFDRDPSFSNYSNLGAAIFTDSPSGRTVVSSASYKF